MKNITSFILSMLIFLAACQKDNPETIIQNPAEIRIEFSQLLEDYYDERGYNVDKGLPSRSKLIELGLEDVADGFD